MDAPRRVLNCSVDSEPVLAHADTGSDVDLVSVDYANHRDWNVVPLPLDRGFVLLADRSLTKVTGYVETQFCIRGNTQQHRFYVLDGLVCDVLIGCATLKSMDAFNQ